MAVDIYPRPTPNPDAIPFRHDIIQVASADSNGFRKPMDMWNKPFGALGEDLVLSHEPALLAYLRAVSFIQRMGRLTDSIKDLQHVNLFASVLGHLIEGQVVAPQDLIWALNSTLNLSLALPSMIISHTALRPGETQDRPMIIPPRPQINYGGYHQVIDRLIEAKLHTAIPEGDQRNETHAELDRLRNRLLSITSLGGNNLSRFFQHSDTLEPETYCSLIYALHESYKYSGSDIRYTLQDGENIFMGYLAHLCMGAGINEFLKFICNIHALNPTLGLGAFSLAAKLGYLSKTDLKAFPQLRHMAAYGPDVWGITDQQALSKLDSQDDAIFAAASAYSENYLISGNFGPPLHIGHLNMIVSRRQGYVVIAPNAYHPIKLDAQHTFNNRCERLALTVGHLANTTVTQRWQPGPNIRVALHSYMQRYKRRGLPPPTLVRGSDKLNPNGDLVSNTKTINYQGLILARILQSDTIAHRHIDGIVADLISASQEALISSNGATENSKHRTTAHRLALNQVFFASSSLARSLDRNLKATRFLLNTESSLVEQVALLQLTNYYVSALRSLLPRIEWPSYGIPASGYSDSLPEHQD